MDFYELNLLLLEEKSNFIYRFFVFWFYDKFPRWPPSHINGNNLATIMLTAFKAYFDRFAHNYDNLTLLKVAKKGVDYDRDILNSLADTPDNYTLAFSTKKHQKYPEDDKDKFIDILAKIAKRFVDKVDLNYSYYEEAYEKLVNLFEIGKYVYFYFSDTSGYQLVSVKPIISAMNIDLVNLTNIENIIKVEPTHRIPILKVNNPTKDYNEMEFFRKKAWNKALDYANKYNYKIYPHVDYIEDIAQEIFRTNLDRLLNPNSYDYEDDFIGFDS